MTEVTTTTATRISDVGGVAVSVAHEERARDFSVERLGIEVRLDVPMGDAEADHVALARAGVRIDPLLHWPGVPRRSVSRDLDGNRFKVAEPAPR